MANIKLAHLVSSPKGKIVKEAQSEHKKDTVFGRDVKKSSHVLNLSKKKAVAKKMHAPGENASHAERMKYFKSK